MKNKIIKIFFTILVLWIGLTGLSYQITESPKDKLAKIAKGYKKYTLFEYKNSDPISALKWTIQLCGDYKAGVSIDHTNIDSFLISTPAITKNGHGNKLYKLFVKDIESYLDTTKKIQPIGQVLIKETWNVCEMHKDSILTSTKPIKQSKNDGKWYTPTTVSELFIMYKENPSVKNDNGWIYGTINMESHTKGPIILENGKISRCITCHKDTKYDRIFGVK